MTVRRYAAAAAACELIPVPIVDIVAQNCIRRAMVAKVARDSGVALSESERRELSDEPIEIGWRLVRAIAIWPAKKLLRTVFFGFAIARMVRVGRDALDLAERVESGAIRE